MIRQTTQTIRRKIRMFIAGSSIFFTTLTAAVPAFANESDVPVDRLPTGAQVFQPPETKNIQSWIPESTRNPAADSEKKSGWKIDSEDIALHPDTDDDLIFRR